MAKLKPIDFTHTNATDDTVTFKSEVTVSQDGWFALTLPEDMVESARTLAQHAPWKGTISIDKPRLNSRVQSRDMGQAQAFIKAALVNFLAVEVTREIVLIYRQKNVVAYCEDEQGQMHPNGYFAGEHYRWHGVLDATHHAEQYSIGLAARAVTKVTARRQASVKVTYEHIHAGTAEDLGPAIARLNGFVGLTFPKAPNPSVQEMPYTEEAAAFFADVMLSMLAMGRRLEQFFSQPDQVQAAITQHQARLAQGEATSLLGLAAPTA